jgi:hypothetical protein
MYIEHIQGWQMVYFHTKPTNFVVYIYFGRIENVDLF